MPHRPRSCSRSSTSTDTSARRCGAVQGLAARPACSPAAARSDSASSRATTTASSARAGRSLTTTRSARKVTHDLHVGYPALQGLRGSLPDLERMGLDQRSGRNAARTRRARRSAAARPTPGVLRRPGQPAGRDRRPDDSLGDRVAELRVQRHDPHEQLDVQRRRARQPGHALRPGSGEGRQRRRLRHLARHEVPDAPLLVVRT